MFHAFMKLTCIFTETAKVQLFRKKKGLPKKLKGRGFE